MAERILIRRHPPCGAPADPWMVIHRGRVYWAPTHAEAVSVARVLLAPVDPFAALRRGLRLYADAFRSVGAALKRPITQNDFVLAN